MPLWAAEPWLRPRFGRVIPERIGHLAANTDLFLRRRQTDLLPEARYALFASGPVANKTLLDLLCRQVPIHRGWRASLFTACEPWLRQTRFWVDLPIHSNEYAIFDGGRVSLRFSEEEESRGRTELARIGLGPDDWFVCFHAREPGYLRDTLPGDWSYHDYRDCSVENFLPAAEYVAKRGGFALRMGAGRLEPLKQGNSRVIDYATRFRSDFMDIYLAAKCRFFIGSDTGLAQVATIFDRPVVNTNVPIVDWASFRAVDLFIQKRLKDASGRFLGYEEILARGFQRFLDGGFLQRHGLSLTENSSEDILGAVREMDERLRGVWKAQPGDEDLQARYRTLFTPRHNCHGFRARMGADFLSRNAGILFAPAPREVPSS